MEPPKLPSVPTEEDFEIYFFGMIQDQHARMHKKTKIIQRWWTNGYWAPVLGAPDGINDFVSKPRIKNK